MQGHDRPGIAEMCAAGESAHRARPVRLPDRRSCRAAHLPAYGIAVACCRLPGERATRKSFITNSRQWCAENPARPCPQPNLTEDSPRRDEGREGARRGNWTLHRQSGQCNLSRCFAAFVECLRRGHRETEGTEKTRMDFLSVFSVPLRSLRRMRAGKLMQPALPPARAIWWRVCLI
jgi:hypothetical protein